MGKGGNNTGWTGAMAGLLLAALPSFAAAQVVVTNPAPAEVTSSVGRGQGVLVDQVIAVVNDDLILESDVDEERRFEAFQPLAPAAGSFSRNKAIERLIDRALILQQAKLQPDISVTDAELDAQLKQLRKDMLACKEFHCETDVGWQRLIEAQGFTVEEFRERWRERMRILKFIEIRFKAGIRITPEEIKTYYDGTLRPQFAQRNATPPPLDTISNRLSEILLQERVGSLLNDWLESLRAQGAVRMMKPGEVPQ